VKFVALRAESLDSTGSSAYMPWSPVRIERSLVAEREQAGLFRPESVRDRGVFEQPR
jgi:hypothetical protein